MDGKMVVLYWTWIVGQNDQHMADCLRDCDTIQVNQALSQVIFAGRTRA